MATTNINCDIDSHLRNGSSYVNTNYGANITLYMGYLASSQSRPILRFTVPSGITSIAQAKLKLLISSAAGTVTNRETHIHGVTRTDWVEAEVTWNSYKSGSSWTAAGGDLTTTKETVYTPSSGVTAGTWLEFDVTAVVRELVLTNGRTQVDLLMKTPDSSTTAGNIYYHSSEATTSSNRPILYLDYATAVNYSDDVAQAALTGGGQSSTDLATASDSNNAASGTMAGQAGTDGAVAADTSNVATASMAGTNSSDLAMAADSSNSSDAAMVLQNLTDGILYIDTLVQELASLAGQDGTELQQGVDAISPVAATAEGGASTDLQGAADTVLMAQGWMAGGASTDLLSGTDTVEGDAASMVGGASTDLQAAIETISPSALTAGGAANTDGAVAADTAMQETMSADGAAISESAGYSDALANSEAAMAGSAASDLQVASDMNQASFMGLAGSAVEVGSSFIDTLVQAKLMLGGSLLKEAESPEARPYSLALYATATGKPIATLDEFTTFSYEKSQNEAGNVTITFPDSHPANGFIRDIYTAEPHGVYAVLYRRGEPFEGLILAETDITKNPVQWSFLTFEGRLREHMTPGSYYSLEGMAISDAITSLCEKGFRWHQKNDAASLQAAVAGGSSIRYTTWHAMSGEAEGYDQPMVVLTGGVSSPFAASGYLTFSFDLAAPTELERVRWQMKCSEKNFIGVQTRLSADNVNWTSWSALTELADEEQAANYGVAVSGTYRYVQVKFTLRTEDRDSTNENDVAVGTSPALLGVELITRYATGLDAYSIDTEGEVIPSGFDFDHDNHLMALASICEDFGYQFRVDYLNRLYVYRSSPASPHILRKGETARPQVIAYTGLDEIENSLTVYGAGDGLGSLSVQVEDADSVGAYGRRPGVVKEGKIATLAELQTYAQEQLDEKAWPKLQCELKTAYELGVEALDARVGEYVAYVDTDTFTGTDSTGYQVFEILSEQRSWGPNGEDITFGLDSDLSNLFTAQSKMEVRRRYKKGRTVSQVPYNVRAVGDFGSVILTWNGAAPEYSVEKATAVGGPFTAIGRTPNETFTATGLATSTGYYFRIRAIYGGSISGPSAVAYAETTTIDTSELDTTPPSTPTGLAGTSATYVGAAGGIVIYNTLTWNAVAETDVAHYELRRRLQTGPGAWQTVGITPSDILRYVDTAGLAENTSYEYSVAAVDRANNRSVWSAEAVVATAADATAPTLDNTSPVVTAGFRRLVPRWIGSPDADLSHYILQRQEAPAEWDGVNNVWKVPTVPVPGSWSEITGSAIRALQYHDTAVDFDTCYRYKVAAVDTSGNISAYTNESAWSVPLQIGTEDAAYRFITAEMYGEIRNVLPYTWRQELDATHPIEVRFYIPSETTNIVSVKLSAYGERFRASSTGAASGGAHTHSVTVPAHDHDVYYSIVGGVETGVLTTSGGGHSHGGATGNESAHTHAKGTLDTVSDSGHSHGISYIDDTSTEAGHFHSFLVSGDTYDGGGHAHGLTGSTAAGSAHSHSITADTGHTHYQSITAVNSTTETAEQVVITSSEAATHTHSIVYGIYESTTPAGVNLYIDNGLGYGSAIALATAPDTTTPYALASELDITAHFSSTGWKKVKLTSTRLGSISGQLILKVDLTA